MSHSARFPALSGPRNDFQAVQVVTDTPDPANSPQSHEWRPPMSQLTTERFDSRRDKIFVPIINWLMRVLLTRDYRLFIQGSIEYGMRSAARDRDENRAAPPEWRNRWQTGNFTDPDMRKAWKDAQGSQQ